MWVCEIKRKSWKAFEHYKNEQISHLNPQLTRSFHNHYPQPHYNLIKSYLILSGLVSRFRQWEGIQKHYRLVKLEYISERLLFFHFSVFSYKHTWGTWIWLQLFFTARMQSDTPYSESFICWVYAGESLKSKLSMNIVWI